MTKQFSSEKRREWEEKVHKQEASGLSISRWCRENQIPIHMFHYWKNRIFPPTLDRLSFTELVDHKGTGLAIECRGVRIYLDKNFEPSTLVRCLTVLKALKC